MTALEWSQYFFHYKSMGIFPDAQGQVTHKSLVGSCWILNPFEMLWLFSLPVRIKKIQLKMKELEWSQVFPIITLWELSVAMEFWSYQAKNLMQPILYPTDAQMKFDYDRPAGLRDIHVWKCGDARTYGHRLESHTISSPWAFRLWWAKNEDTRVLKTSPIISLWEFFQKLDGSKLHSPWLDLAEFRTSPRFYGFTRYL